MWYSLGCSGLARLQRPQDWTGTVRPGQNVGAVGGWEAGWGLTHPTFSSLGEMREGRAETSRHPLGSPRDLTVILGVGQG